MTRTEALLEVARNCASDQYPELDSSDLAALVDKWQVYTVWTASTAYVVGDKVIPTVSNGRLYLCIIAGTSDTVEPGWPDYVTQPYYAIGDGQDLEWQDIGPAPVQYDVMSASREGWLLKASRAAGLVNVTDGAVSASMGSLQDKCIRQAARFLSMRIL